MNFAALLYDTFPGLMPSASKRRALEAHPGLRVSGFAFGEQLPAHRLPHLSALHRCPELGGWIILAHPEVVG